LAKKSLSQLRQDIQKNKIARAYLFTGPQEDQKREITGLLCTSFIAPGSEMFNLDQRRADQTEISELQNLVATLPWNSPGRIVTLQAVEQLSAEQRQSLSKLVEKVPATTCLILLAEKLPAADKLLQAVDRSGVVVEFGNPKEEDLIAWITEQFANQKKIIDPSAAEVLAQGIGPDLSSLTQEIEKLLNYAGQREKISSQDVYLHLRSSPQFKVYQLIDSISTGDVQSAIEITESVLDNQGYAGIITNQLMQDYFHLWRLFSYTGSRSDFSGLARHLGLERQVFRVRKYLSGSRNHTLPKIEAALQKVSAADSALRYSPLSAEILIEKLVIELCRLTETYSTDKVVN
jgi:DNA polymerase-3 subunit delta